MSLLNLFFGRKRRARAAGGVGSTVASPDKLAGLVAQGAHVGSLPEPETFKAALAVPNPPVRANAQAAAEARGKVSDAAILRRVTGLTLGRDASPEARQAAVLDRLSIVHDPNEVLISAADRFARLAIADRRLMSARFGRKGTEERVFDFRHDMAPEGAAIDCLRSLATLCAEPVDLLIVEQSISGVFASVGGFAVGDISFDEDLFRAALQEARQVHNLFECEDEGGEPLPEMSDASLLTAQLPAADALQVLRLTLKDNPNAFAEEEAEFVGAEASAQSD